MLAKKKHPEITFLNIVIFFLVITFFGSGMIDLSIKSAQPFIVLSLLTVYCCYSSVFWSAVAGILCGAFCDSISSGSYCFNTLCLLILAVLCNLLANSVFNKNLKATVALCLFISTVYYFFYWIIFLCFRMNFDNNALYLLKFALPSVFYTAVFVFLFYPIYRKFDKIRNEKS